MTATMPILTLDDVKPGMTLAQAVYTHQTGSSWRRPPHQRKHVRIFKSWGLRRLR
jgi:hypothetical protein